jgi:hypothetical protein
MTDKPATIPPREPLVLPPNFRDVTAERMGVITGILGAPKPEPTAPPSLRLPGSISV